ncbi:MAG: hypothetical protein QM768_15340 [Agriterribacter sp.]
MKKKVLFIPAPIRSHILPSFYLADKLSVDCNIAYAVANPDLGKLVTDHGFSEILLAEGRFCMGHDPLVLCNDKGYADNKVSFWKASLYYFRQEVYLKRKRALTKIVEEYCPGTIIIDIFSATDFIILFSFYPKIKLIFYNPMLSTYSYPNYPSVTEGTFAKAVNPQKKKYGDIFSLRNLTYILTGLNPVIQLKRALWNSNIPRKFRRDKSNKLVLIFKNVPEIILAPNELEFTSISIKPNQKYLGLCVSPKNHEIDTDTHFEERLKEIKALRANGNKIIYCSFGTYFSSKDDHIVVAEFIIALFEALRYFKNFRHKFILKLQKNPLFLQFPDIIYRKAVILTEKLLP